MPERNRGKFDDSRPLVATISFRRMTPGTLVEVGSRSKRRDWWKRGWCQYADQKEIEQLEDDAVSEASEAPVEETGEEDVVAVSAEEGQKGWWTVTFSDGSEKKMRLADVEALGLLEEEDDGDPGTDQ